MKRMILAGGFVLSLVLLIWLASTGVTSASAMQAADKDIPRGGALYDKWYAVLGVAAPSGNHPLWSRQSTNTRSGEDTWRCVECHGWDYQGKDGAYGQGSNHYTGFPSVYAAVQNLSEADIVAHLKGSKDPAHDFSAYLDDASLKQIAKFLKQALINDDEYIDPQTLKVLNADLANGKTRYDTDCAACHGADGQKITFRFEGSSVSLGGLSAADPWRFLHKTRFGTPGTPMPIGYELGWTPQDGRDALFYAQTLPGGNQREAQPAVVGEGQITPQPSTGGPPKGILGGILTAIAAMATGLGLQIIVAAALVGILLLLVWVVRGRSK